jgi:hypothetical protein
MLIATIFLRYLRAKTIEFTLMNAKILGASDARTGTKRSRIVIGAALNAPWIFEHIGGMT